MGIYTDYLNAGMNPMQLEAARKQQLRTISSFRGGRDILVYAADLRKSGQRGLPLGITYEDLLPIQDQLANMNGSALDFIIETPGGMGEIAEDMVHLLRLKYDHMAVIIPGTAKSAGTIMAMAGDEILMGPGSTLGPIDAQLAWQGKAFSADALLQGFKKIRKEVDDTGRLNRAYVPMLSNISPGDLQSAENALTFATSLVRDWLVRYKFKDWPTHSSTGEPVTSEEKQKRAQEIADRLCDHAHWLTHGRSIRLENLQEMRLKITDYSEQPGLAEAIRRYHTLLQLTFEGPIYKVYETIGSQIIKVAPQVSGAVVSPRQAQSAVFDLTCRKCQGKSKVQANFDKAAPLAEGAIAFPVNNKLNCPHCGAEIDLTPVRKELETKVRRPVV
jgi:hypothetical protein